MGIPFGFHLGNWTFNRFVDMLVARNAEYNNEENNIEEIIYKCQRSDDF